MKWEGIHTYSQVRDDVSAPLLTPYQLVPFIRNGSAPDKWILTKFLSVITKIYAGKNEFSPIWTTKIYTLYKSRKALNKLNYCVYIEKCFRESCSHSGEHVMSCYVYQVISKTMSMKCESGTCERSFRKGISLWYTAYFTKVVLELPSGSIRIILKQSNNTLQKKSSLFLNIHR